MRRTVALAPALLLFACSEPTSPSPGSGEMSGGTGGASSTILWPANHTFKLQPGIGVHVWHKGAYLRGAIVMRIVDTAKNLVWIGQPHNGAATYVLHGKGAPEWIEVADGDEENALGIDAGGGGVWPTCHYVNVVPGAAAWFSLGGSAPDVPGTYYLRANEYPRPALPIVIDSNGAASLLLARGEVAQDGGTMGDPDAGPGQGVGYAEQIDGVPHATSIENRSIDGDPSCVRAVQ